MKNKALQMFTDDYLENCKKMSSHEILKFLDDFRKLHGNPKSKLPSKLISIKIPPELLSVFKKKSELLGIPYQTQIKKIMQEWISF